MPRNAASTLLLLLLPSASAFVAGTSHALMHLRGQPHLLNAATMRVLPDDVQEANSWDKGTYKEEDVEENYEALIELYGSVELANAAVKQVRGVVLCPLYASPTLLSDSKSALVEVVGEEEAAVIMKKNPSVLTVGPELANADPDEIRRLANLREFLDQIPPSVLLGVTLGVSAIIGLRILLIQTGNLPYVQ